jgi:hypothetical protein
VTCAVWAVWAICELKLLRYTHFFLFLLILPLYYYYIFKILLLLLLLSILLLLSLSLLLLLLLLIYFYDIVSSDIFRRDIMFAMGVLWKLAECTICCSSQRGRAATWLRGLRIAAVGHVVSTNTWAVQNCANKLSLNLVLQLFSFQGWSSVSISFSEVTLSLVARHSSLSLFLLDHSLPHRQREGERVKEIRYVFVCEREGQRGEISLLLLHRIHVNTSIYMYEVIICTHARR